MRDEAGFPVDPVGLWNTVLAVMTEGVALARRGRAVVTVASEEAVAGGAATFRIMTENGSIFAAVRHLPLGAITRSGLEMEALPRLPGALSDSILREAIGLVLREAGAALPNGMQAISRCEAGAICGAERLLLTLDGVWTDRAEIALQADRAALHPLLMGMMPVATPGHLPEAVAARITLPCTLRLMGRTVALARLQALGTGDILLLPDGAKQVLHLPQGAWTLRHDGTNWTMGNQVMNDDLPPVESTGPQSAEPATGIGEVPVRLSFVLAEQTLTVADMQRLVAGAYLPFDPAPSGPGQAVRILANGRPIGDGHVVEVDGQTAVRIARLFGG